jgi:hypothetical protein
MIRGLLVGDKMELFELANLGAHLMTGVEGLLLAKLVVQPVLRENILEAQRKDDKLKEIRKRMGLEQNTPFRILKNGMLALDKRICLLDDKTLKEEVLSRAHKSKLAIHPGSTKIYMDLKE